MCYINVFYNFSCVSQMIMISKSYIQRPFFFKEGVLMPINAH